MCFVLRSLPPFNPAAETVFCHYFVCRLLYQHTFQCARSMQCVPNGGQKIRAHTQTACGCAPENVECDKNIDKIYSLFTLSGVFDVFSYFNVYYTSGAFFSLGFNGFFLFTSLVWIKLSLLLIAIYVDYWEIVFCSCSAVFAYFSPALHSLGRLFVPFVHASAHVYKKNCMCVCVTQKLVHRLKRVMNSQLLW